MIQFAKTFTLFAAAICALWAATGSLITASLIALFAFLFYSVGDNNKRRREAEARAEREAARALEFQQYALRRHRRLMRYRAASKKIVGQLEAIVSAQDQIVRIVQEGTTIKSLLINNVLFVPALNQPAPPQEAEARGGDGDDKWPDVIGEAEEG